MLRDRELHPMTIPRLSSMTTKQKTVARWSVLIGPLLAALVGGWKFHDNRYVHQDKYSLDSLRIENHMEEEHKVLARVDKKLNIIVCGGLEGAARTACETQ